MCVSEQALWRVCPGHSPLLDSMAPAAEIAELKGELRSIERLIEDLLQQQMELCSWLACLESADSEQPLAAAATAPTGASGLASPSWSSVANGRKRLSLPLYDPLNIGSDDDISLRHFFSPLAGLPSESPIISTGLSAGHGQAPRSKKRVSRSTCNSPYTSPVSKHSRVNNPTTAPGPAAPQPMSSQSTQRYHSTPPTC